MKLSKYRETYYDYSGKVSDVARQLSFAGIVVIWIFKTGDNTDLKVPSNLILPLALFSFALACDLLQYIMATVIWGSFHRYHEKKLTNLSEDPDLTAPYYFTWPITSFFILKLMSVIAGYLILLKFFWGLLTQHI